MSEQPHLRSVREGELQPTPKGGPKRFKLPHEVWARLNDGLRNNIQASGGTTIGDEVLQFSSDAAEQARGMTKLLAGTMSGDPHTYPGIGVGVVELRMSDEPEDTVPTIFFPGVLDPAEISVKASRAMAETNLILEAVQSPLRFPSQ